MSDLNLLITIANRKRLPDFISAYRQSGLEIHFIALGHGTATGEIRGVLGLSESEKAVCHSVVSEESWKKAKIALYRNVQIDVPDTGVAFTVPLSSVGGRRELEFLTDGQNYEKGKVSEMKGTLQELIVVVCKQGCSEIVMDAARKAGARGGTVVHARGTGMEKAEQFLGIRLSSEKDIIYIVAKTSERSEIMKIIMQEAGQDSEAQSIVFSLPVSDSAGIRFLPEDDGE